MRSPLSRSQTPTAPRRGSRFFQVWLLPGLPRRANHSAYFGLAKFCFGEPFQPSTEANLESCLEIVNARFQCNRPAEIDQKPETQSIESSSLNEMGDLNSSVLAQEHPQVLEGAGRATRSVCRNQRSVVTRKIRQARSVPAVISQNPRGRSMSSIKRDVKKKASP